jgi:hypothetical protein
MAALTAKQEILPIIDATKDATAREMTNKGLQKSKSIGVLARYYTKPEVARGPPAKPAKPPVPPLELT